MKPTTCPKCGSKLETLQFDDIEIERCCQCAGLWFDSLEAEQLKSIQGSEILDLGNPEENSRFDRLSKDIKCPRCRGKMLRMLDIDLYTIWYEKCTKCHGVWLDAGEFKRYKQNFQPKGVIKRAKEALRHMRQ
ncbi:hypothetical protein PCC7424_3171 [Gloeothece citriformis PCC 7424]|uniref:Transcription factor zinc-finger domain-containing protein n=1 Tax=Gloeothece citriformis (strain PCC 7424) TaxID=65393 RepID=B7KCM2_GLOC7|nr:zf-TFIIB domain-containing protein [Gloeothece citriformis]ACK71573.1 hypothetical protein PCC7424_3171 [Gloeothece citriformis PCC 7424]